MLECLRVRTWRQVMLREKHLKSDLFVNSLQDLIWYNFNNWIFSQMAPCQKKPQSLVFSFLFLLNDFAFKPGTIQQKTNGSRENWGALFTLRLVARFRTPFRWRRYLLGGFGVVVCRFVALRFQFCSIEFWLFPNYRAQKTKAAWEEWNNHWKEIFLAMLFIKAEAFKGRKCCSRAFN